MGIRYAEKIQIIPVMVPDATTSADDKSAYVKIQNAQWVSFLCYWSSLTSDSTDTASIMVYSSTAGSTTNAVAQPFKYRLCEAVGGDTWGTISSATAAAGVSITGVDDNKVLLIDVDPASLYALDTDATFIHLLVDGSGMRTNPAFGATCFLEPRYPQNANLGTTA
jgi:hypothetical protein